MTAKKNYQQPFYTIRFKSQHCGYRLAVNGCVIEDDRIGEQSAMEYPINHWLKSGENTIDIYHLNINTPFGKKGLLTDGCLNLELCVRENDSHEVTVLSTTEYNGAKLNIDENRANYDDIDALRSTIETSTQPTQFDVIDDQVILSDQGAFIIGDYQVKKGITKALQITQKLTLPAPFPLWRFFEADDLPYHNDLSDDEWKATRQMMIDEVYQPIWQALHDDDAQAIKDLFAGRGKELDQAFYKKNGQDVYEMVVHLRGIINDDDLSSVRELDFDYCDVAVAFNHKLSWLHNWKLSLSSKLAFDHLGADIETRIPVMFARFDGKWEIVR